MEEDQNLQIAASLAALHGEVRGLMNTTEIYLASVVAWLEDLQHSVDAIDVAVGSLLDEQDDIEPPDWCG